MYKVLSEGAYLLLRRMVDKGEVIPYGDTSDPEYRASLSQEQIELLYMRPPILRAENRGFWFWRKTVYVPDARGQVRKVLDESIKSGG